MLAARMAEDERTRRWRRISRPPIETDQLQVLRAAIAAVRARPHDPEARRRLRALAADEGAWEQLAVLLGDEARAAADRPAAAVAFYEELADVYENLDQSVETIAAMEQVVAIAPDEVEHRDRLARLYHRIGAKARAAEAFEEVARLARDDRGRAALRAAGRLWRELGKSERAVDAYRGIIERRPADLDAWRALDELLYHLGRWPELAEVRGTLALHASGVEKAVLLRQQARALERAGAAQQAAELVEAAAHHAPDDVSGLVDYAQVLAREGRGRDAANVLAARIAEAGESGASGDEVAALRLRLAQVLDDACLDRAGALAMLEELLADAPEHAAALDELVRLAAVDPDPRVHAAALERRAAVLAKPADRAAAFAEAARRWRDAHDDRAAAAALERAAALAPDDAALREEVENHRAVQDVARARADAAAGRPDDAERRLRAILGARPLHTDAVLALADVLARAGRAAEAADHLRETLAEHAEALPDVARVVHRYARAMAELGEADEAHQLLHEAHRLDRRDLEITLALGESCYARRLWREAAIHLGALADHPDAASHAAAVAAGLVHAALAETRALRPANAPKHYEAAVRIDPACARAWHALAEIASQRGEHARALDCLEHEAAATSELRERDRLFEAAGELAAGALGDPARAERCWAEVRGAPGALRKLLALRRKRGAGRERGETCERLAAVIGDAREKKELAEEAAQAFAGDGDLAHARDLASALVAAHPHDLDAVTCASGIALAAGDVRAAATWLHRALVAWDADGDDGEGDPRRAELWRRLGDAERARERGEAALNAYRRAVVTAPESDGALAARRALVGLAAAPAAESLGVIVEAEQEPADVLAWARALARDHGDDPARLDDGRAAYELARALGAPLSAADLAFVEAHPARPMASDEAYGAPLPEAERRALVDDPHDAPLGDVLELLGEIAPLVCPDPRAALDRAGLGGARRVSSASDAAAAVMYPQIANALGGPQTLLYAIGRGPDLALLLAAPPLVVLGPRLAALRARSTADGGAGATVGSASSASQRRGDGFTGGAGGAPVGSTDGELGADRELRFRLGRVVELARPRRVFAAGTAPEVFARLVGGLVHAFGRAPDPPEPAAAAEAERLRGALSVPLRRRITELLAHATIDPAAYLAACERAADRAGLLACGDAATAIALAGGPTAARHLVRLAAQPAFLAARRRLRARR
jgi:tetratricopeptide (TPR) repeat protein